ncbi:ferredoxin [Halorussus sp. MSC15.2]|uniref:(2Fe-2S) ferredoxin domain-containing protein n=1 Tax=Halorussus sp. MSC15.2 TaxID=2283638 RepID=UPI0013D51479|nr:(2Fe-2S) ferredoxin domain-containing protein [Halorussus sp. MSC15.2]NEU58218.1 (2Fe-2S) ferredoxin domain-containing protein [Halorussus sp. MSC15.2]
MRERTEEVRVNGFTDHVLVCTHARDSEHACCGDAHGPSVFEATTAWLRERDVLWSRVHLVETSCLGLCSADGTAVAVQPRGRWFSGVTPDEVPEVLADVFGPDATRLGVGPSDSDGSPSDGC